MLVINRLCFIKFPWSRLRVSSHLHVMKWKPREVVKLSANMLGQPQYVRLLSLIKHFYQSHKGSGKMKARHNPCVHLLG